MLGFYINYICGYLLCGLFMCFFYDKLVDTMPEQEENRLNWGERFAVMVFWPITVVIFVYYFIKGLLDD